MADTTQKWILKQKDGRIRGPYSTVIVIEKIRKGEFSGDEQISTYPGGNWIPLSQEVEFYDQLLESLAGQLNDIESESKEVPLTQATKGGGQKKIDKDETPVQADKSEFQLTSPKSKRKRDRDGTVVGGKTRVISPDRTQYIKRDQDTPEEIIELVDLRKQIKTEVAKRGKWPILVIILIVVAAIIILSLGERQGDRIHLLRIQTDQTSDISQQDFEQGMSKSARYYLSDTYIGYLKAQDELVKLAQSKRKNAEAMAILCMTYFELWPYSFQDAQDIRTISVASQIGNSIDPGGVHGSTCQVVNMIVRNRIPEAKTLVESVLNEQVDTSKPPIMFYFLKAYLLQMTREYQSALGYLDSAQRLWPQWTRAYSLYADIFVKMKNYEQAANSYRKIIKANPKHRSSQIQLGIIEAQHFRHHDIALGLLREGLKGDLGSPPKLKSEGHYALAEIYLYKGEQNKALDEAKKSFDLYSGNQKAKDLIVRLGGKEILSRSNAKSHQLIFEGDQFAREGDCNAAQAHFKAAFEMEPDNAIAAMKAAKCLWKLSFSNEAIQWLNKAIKADSNLIEAYVLMADYYTQRFNFIAGARILAKAQRVSPKSYEVYRGFALVELRRNNPKGSVTFGERALSIYGSDIDTHLIMARAYIALKDFRQAYVMSARAIEFDVNHREAQTVYAEALAGIEGIEIGLDYMLNLVNTYPLVDDYRMAYGQMLYKDERYEDSEDVFRQLIEIQEKPKEAHVWLAKSVKEQNKFEQALDSLLKAAVADPADAGPLFEAGKLYIDIDRPREAKIQFQRVLTINKRYPRVYYFMGKAALKMKAPKKALEYAKSEMKINPNLADSYLLSAEAYFAMGQFNLCAGQYQKAIRLRPQGARIYVKLGRCYRKYGKLDVAIAMLNQASSQESGYPEIYKELGAVYEQKGEIDKAIESYNQYFVLNPNAPDRQQIEMRIKSSIQ